jgi:hypothetical protein
MHDTKLNRPNVCRPNVWSRRHLIFFLAIHSYRFLPIQITGNTWEKNIRFRRSIITYFFRDYHIRHGKLLPKGNRASNWVFCIVYTNTFPHLLSKGKTWCLRQTANGIKVQIVFWNQLSKICSSRLAVGLCRQTGNHTRQTSNPFSYPKPFLRAARRGALAKSITGYHEHLVTEYIRY